MIGDAWFYVAITIYFWAGFCFAVRFKYICMKTNDWDHHPTSKRILVFILILFLWPVDPVLIFLE